VKGPEINLFQPHSRPFPNEEDQPCSGQYVTSRVVLGTDFRTDIALFSLPLDAPFQLRPGNDETATALRTLCEALAKAACLILEIEPGEILAEYRPALTAAGASGLEVEIFLYDTLAGGAGFSPQLVGRGPAVFAQALQLLSACPAQCDASCYRCLRTFRNKFEHGLLDRKLGEQLLMHALDGGYPAYPPDRVALSLNILHEDLNRQFSAEFQFERNVPRTHNGLGIIVPLTARRRSSSADNWITVASPIAPGVPVQDELRALGSSAPIICIDDLLVRRHLPHAANMVQQLLR
jgi:hypothetical protein